MQTRADRWLDRQPLWLYSAIAFIAGLGVWAVSVYGGGVASGGIHAGDAGFDHGTFSFSHALIAAASWMVLAVGFRWRQRGRKALFWVLLLAALVGGPFLIAVTPA